MFKTPPPDPSPHKGKKNLPTKQHASLLRVSMLSLNCSYDDLLKRKQSRPPQMKSRTCQCRFPSVLGNTSVLPAASESGQGLTEERPPLQDIVGGRVSGSSTAESVQPSAHPSLETGKRTHREAEFRLRVCEQLFTCEKRLT